MALTLSALNVYPVKSCGGVSLTNCDVDSLGLKDDRRWMFLDQERRFQTQRWQQRLALVRTALTPDGVKLSAPGMTPMVARRGGGPVIESAVWEFTVTTESCGQAPDDWISEFLGEPIRMVYFPDSSIREMDGNHARTIGRVGLADGYPFLLVGAASLEDLNARLPAPIPMNRFRPNLVVSGSDPYAEDEWRRLKIGGIEFTQTKRCVRCRIPTIDQDTAESGKEPSRTLATYRKTEEGVVFGVNLAHQAPGLLRVDDSVAILEHARQ